MEEQNQQSRQNQQKRGRRSAPSPEPAQPVEDVNTGYLQQVSAQMHQTASRDRQLPQHYDDTIFEHHDTDTDTGWHERVYTPVTTSAVPPEREDSPQWEEDEKQVPSEPRRFTEQPKRPGALRRFFTALNLSWFDAFALVFLIANLIGFGRAYFDSNLIQLVFYGVVSILTALAFFNKK